jgi:hypothetical protein
VKADLGARNAAVPATGVEAVAHVLPASGILTVTGLKVRKEVLMALTTDMRCVIQKAETNQF